MLTDQLDIHRGQSIIRPANNRTTSGCVSLGSGDPISKRIVGRKLSLPNPLYYTPGRMFFIEQTVVREECVGLGLK